MSDGRYISVFHSYIPMDSQQRVIRRRHTAIDFRY